MGSTVESQNMPDWANSYALAYLAKAQRMAATDTKEYSTRYDGDTYAEQNFDETDGIQAIIDRGKNHSPIVEKAKELLSDILSGKTLNINTKIQAQYARQAELIIKEFKEDIIPAIDDEALRLMCWGSSGHAIRKAKATENTIMRLLQISENLFYDDYETEQNRRIGLLGYVIPYGHESVRDIELIRNGALYDREWKQGKREDKYRLWVSEQGDEATKLDIHGNAVRSLVGSYSSETRPFYRPGGFAQFAGVALAGAGLAAQYFGKTKNNTMSLSKQDYSGMNSIDAGSNVAGWQAPKLTGWAGTEVPSQVQLGAQMFGWQMPSLTSQSQ